MLTYRSIFELSEDDAFERIVEPALFRWLSERKGYDLDKLGPRWTSHDHSRASLVTSDEPGGRVRRLRLEEDSGYSTAVITVERPREPARFWIEIDSPLGKQPAKPPAFLRDILGQVQAQDGAAPLPDSPLLYSRDDIGLLAEQINDEDRHGVLFVAGTSPDLPNEEWRRLVSAITQDTCGMATTVILAADATDAFNSAHEPLGYQVPPGTIRSFQPGAHLEDESDARRNKILGTGRLVADSERYLQRVLASVARRAVVGLPLTKAERDAKRALDKSEANILLGLSEQSATVLTPDEGTPAVVADALPEQKSGRRKSDGEPSLDPTAAALGHAFLNKLVRAVTRTFENNWGRGQFQASDLPLIEQALLPDPEATRRDREQVGAEFAEIQQSLSDLETQLKEAHRSLEDLDLELAIERDEAQNKSGEMRTLRKRLAMSLPSEEAYAEVEKDPRDDRPTSFAALQEHIHVFTNLTFTCDWDETASLDDSVQAPTSRLYSLWEGFLALDDYARAKRDDAFAGSFFEYNNNSPAGYASIPSNRYAATESETVRGSRKFMADREFRVPDSVNPSGVSAMTSHLRAGNKTTDPRAYFLDATANHQIIVVGYIGRHLDVKSTN